MQGNGAAAAAQTIRSLKIGERTILLGKLTFRDFASVREEACADCKRSLILTYTRNMDLVPPEKRDTIVQEAFEKAEKLTPDSLPPKKAWLPKRDAAGRVVNHHGERFFHGPSSQWIEPGEPLLEEQDIEYSGWWMAQTNMGRIYATWLSMRKCQGQEAITLDDVAAMFTAEEDLEVAANVVGDLSQQRLGNAQAPPEAAPAGRA